MGRIVRHIVAAVCFIQVLFSTGCVSPTQATATDVDSRSWREGAVIELDNADTLTMRDIDIFLRCNERMSQDTLTLNIAVYTPDSLWCEEALLMPLTRERRAAALSTESTASYRRRVVFAHSGNYRILITPARPVEGVEAVGINIIKSK